MNKAKNWVSLSQHKLHHTDNNNNNDNINCKNNEKNHDYIYYDEVRVTCVIIGPKRGLNIMAIQKRKKMSREW